MIQYCDLKVLVLRRSYDVAPPTVGNTSPYHPSNDPRYETHEFPDEELLRKNVIFKKKLCNHLLFRALQKYEVKGIKDTFESISVSCRRNVDCGHFISSLL